MSSPGISYELALQIKNAGFPQGLTEHQYGWIEAHQDFELDNGDMTKGVSAPTLSELISACRTKDGDPIAITLYSPETWGIWKAVALRSVIHDRVPYSRTGEDAEEAVSKLWIALNEKNV